MKTSNIRGFPGYHVTKHGKVYRKGSGKWSLLPIKKWGNNYVVNLTNSYKRRTFIVARLVAMTHIPNPEVNPVSKLTDRQRKEMVDKYKTGKYSMMGLSKEYGLKSTTTIFRLMHPDRRLTH